MISYYNRPNNHRASGESDCGSVLRGMSTCTARKQDLIDLICLVITGCQLTNLAKIQFQRSYVSASCPPASSKIALNMEENQTILVKENRKIENRKIRKIGQNE